MFLFFCLSIAQAQDFKVISGQLLDKDTGKGVPYANIGIPERGIGTTSNDYGYFTFKVPNYYLSSDLIVSVIGYKTFKSPVKDFGESVVIDLDPTSYSLSEIQIVDENGVENIIRKAVSRIPDNYPTYPTTVLGFYRESRTDSLDQHVYLAEGVLNIHKDTYKSSKEGMVSLVQGRKLNLKNPLDTIIRGGFSSGHMAGHRFDFVKNKEDFIDEDFFPAYKYWVESITTYNDREVYVIGFDKDPEGSAIKKKKKKRSVFNMILGGSKYSSKDARLRGRVYIEKESYAFIRAEFEVTEKGLRKYDDYPLYTGRWTFNKYVVNYQQVDGKWYFSDALREGGRRDGGVFSNEIKVTQVNTERAKPIPYLERIDDNEEFVDMTGQYDEDFWQSYNTVPMSEKLSESMQQFKNAQKAEQVFAPERMQEIQELRDSLALAERIAKAEREAKEKEETFDIESMVISEPKNQRRRNRRFRTESTFGLGTHLLSTPETQLGVSYLAMETNEPLLSIDNMISARDFEAIYSTGLNMVFNGRWIVQFDFARDFGRTIYRESSSGVGVQFNLSKQRPVFFKLVAQHNRNRYARVLGTVMNDPQGIRIENKNFNSDRVRVLYGSRTSHLKLSGEVAIELNRNREMYIRGSYYLPYAQKQEVNFRETSIFFRKRVRLDVDSDRVAVTSNDLPFDASILNAGRLQFTLGFVLK